MPRILPIIGSDKTIYYRNKLEFTFSNKRYLLPGEMDNPDVLQQGALGFHVPRLFDKIIDIDECYLMDGVNNSIRNTISSPVVQ